MVAEKVTGPDIVSHTFAEEVRADRLDIIWKATLGVMLFFVWFIVLFSIDLAKAVILPTASVIIATFLCRLFLKRDKLEIAIWCYGLGMLAAIGLLLLNDNADIRRLMPFAVLVVLYVTGLMLPIRGLIPLTILSILTINIAPWIGDSEVSFPNDSTLTATFLAILAALITAQASGELFAIAEWALESYRRERASATSLFESRQEVERSLLRQRALTTELQKTNEDLAEARRAAEEAKHFRGQFLANMSHELRTPLNAVIGFSETMLNFPPMYNNVELPEDYRRDLQQIHNSGRHLLNIINDILDLSKIDVGRLDVDMVRVELEPIFKGVLSTAVGLVGGKPIKLQRDLPASIPDVLGDPVRIRQVLLNLYSNASKFTDEGNITLGMRYDDQQATIWVADSGIGISPQNMDIIFEEFRQAAAGRKQARAGSGLGLAISRQLLNLMGGEIWVESAEGEGSTFYFTLPLYRENAGGETTSDEQMQSVSEAQ